MILASMLAIDLPVSMAVELASDRARILRVSADFR